MSEATLSGRMQQDELVEELRKEVEELRPRNKELRNTVVELEKQNVEVGLGPASSDKIV